MKNSKIYAILGCVCAIASLAIALDEYDYTQDVIAKPLPIEEEGSMEQGSILPIEEQEMQPIPLIGYDQQPQEVTIALEEQAELPGGSYQDTPLY